MFRPHDVPAPRWGLLLDDAKNDSSVRRSICHFYRTTQLIVADRIQGVFTQRIRDGFVLRNIDIRTMSGFRYRLGYRIYN